MADREERTYYVKLYVERGYVVIPVRFGDPQDKYWGKIPLGENWQLVTLEECPGNFERANQRQTELNIGIRTGKDSNLIVVDIDLANSGMEYYREVLEPMLRLNNCFPPMIQTGSGGYHLYFGYTPYAARLVNRSKLQTPQGLFGIDVKTNGGYVVGVPSLHKSGNRYSFFRGDISNRPEMPNWLVDFLQPIKVREPVPVRFTPRYRYSEVQIVELLNLLSDYRADSYTEWRDVCFSIGRSLQQSYESLLIMRDFSARSNKCHDRNNEEKIVGFFQASYRDDGYSINHLIELAEEDNPDGLRAWKQRYPIKNAIERALRQDADDVIEEIDTENESVDGSGNESDSESDNNLEVNSAPKAKTQPIQVSKQINTPNQIIVSNLVEPISQPVNQQRLVTLASITNPKSIAKAVVKVRELVELITPVQDLGQVSQIIWAIIKSTNNATGYVDLVHELAIKWLNSEYSVSKIAEIIKLTRQNGKGFGEKFLVGRAKVDNPSGYKEWLTKYKAKKALTKQQRLQAEKEQKLTTAKLADLIIDSFNGKAGIFYYQDEWYQWVDRDDDGEVVLWVNRKISEIIGIMSITTEAELIERDFTDDNIIKYSDPAKIGKALGIIQVKVTMKEWPATPAWDLPIQGGQVLNLKTGQVRLRTHEDYFTFECKINLDLVNSTGTARVDRFFQTTSWGQGDGFKPWIINYCLYALSGELNPKRPNVLSIEGLTSNGKSTLISTIRKVLGGYGGSLPSAVLFDSDNTQRAHDTHLLQLRNKRCVIFSEIGDKPVNMETLKRITGGDELTARGANERKFVDFESVAKVLIVANNRLNIDFTDAITRRVKCVEVKAQFFDEPELWDESEGRFEATDIKDWLATPEGLACFVDYLVKNGQEGKIVPLPNIVKEISLENAENAKPNHEIFFQDWLVFDHSATMKLDQIWEHYTKWLKAKSLTPSKTKNNLPASLRLIFPDVYTGTKTRAYRLKLRNGPQIG